MGNTFTRSKKTNTNEIIFNSSIIKIDVPNEEEYDPYGTLPSRRSGMRYRCPNTQFSESDTDDISTPTIRKLKMINPLEPTKPEMV